MKMYSFFNPVLTGKKKILAQKRAPRSLHARLAGSHFLLKEKTFFLGRLQQALQ
jgi:hypothetical protein